MFLPVAFVSPGLANSLSIQHLVEEPYVHILISKVKAKKNATDLPHHYKERSAFKLSAKEGMSLSHTHTHTHTTSVERVLV